MMDEKGRSGIPLSGHTNFEFAANMAGKHLNQTTPLPLMAKTIRPLLLSFAFIIPPSSFNIF
jgi:hypothetical protein